MVVEIELTLVSIIQGVALSYLIDSARNVMFLAQSEFWPYVAAGLFVILIFWSRAVLHIITVIRWPLEFGHNFLYIACALGEALLLTRLNNPRAWFALGAVYSAIAWAVFAYDLRLLRAREEDSAGAASNRLYALLTADQWRNIQFLLPGVFLLNLVCAISVRAWPESFVVGKGHVWLALGQTVAFAAYLIYVVRFFTTLAPLILEARAEWRGQAQGRED